MKKKVISIVGARPNFIKLAAISPLLNKQFNHIVIHTGQHYDYEMSKSIFDEFSLSNANYNLEVGSLSDVQQISQILSKSFYCVSEEKPDLILVYGDTNSTLAGALCAAKMNIPLAHIEAGLRCYDKTIPEEINRLVIDHISSILFCPTKISSNNLKKESIISNVYLTGDLMYDLFLKMKSREQIIKQFNLSKKDYYFCTIHRQHNVDNVSTLQKIFREIESLDKVVIMPIHPRTKRALAKMRVSENKVKFIDPVKYSESLALIKNAYFVITDSGGIQKEAYWSKTPCITLRTSTEWLETVKSGWNVLYDQDKNTILKLIKNFKKPKIHPNYYGDGSSAQKITQIIQKCTV